MPKSTAAINVGSNGTIYVAPVGTVAPVDPFVAWGAAWVDLGYASEDGVTFNDAKTTERIGVWQMFYAARYIVTERDTMASFTLRQWDKNTVPLAFGGGTITTTAASAGPPVVAAHYLYTPPAPSLIDERALGIQWEDGAKVYRLIMPRVMVTEGVETNLTHTNAADLPITCGVMGVDGATAWTLRTNDPSFAAA